MTGFLFVSALLIFARSMASAQPVRNPADALLDVLVYGTHIGIDPAAYSPRLRAEVERYLRRSRAYRSKLKIPAEPENRMGRDAAVGYERRLVALSSRPAAALAAAYVAGLRPCYEWEGFHDCPEREARFADAYQARHPGGPFSTYLPLLAAHRWLCTAEAYEYEKKPDDAARSRAAYLERVATARGSARLLIRTAAERLMERGRCLASG